MPTRPRALLLAAGFAALAFLPAASVAEEAAPALPALPLCLQPRDGSTALLAFGADGHTFDDERCTGAIRPGAAMTAPAFCTLNFVFTDSAQALYIGTAGHCVGGVNQRVSAQGVGPFGNVVFRRLQGVNDFALIKIDADKHALVSPTMCTWGGPIGPNEAAAQPDLLLEYGWGFATQFASTTRARMHVQASVTANSVSWNGVGSGGDSGAPVVDQAGRAVAIHTFGQTPLAGVVLEGGPSFANVLAMGRTAVPSLELVPGHPSTIETAFGRILG